MLASLGSRLTGLTITHTHKQEKTTTAHDAQTRVCTVCVDCHWENGFKRVRGLQYRLSDNSRFSAAKNRQASGRRENSSISVHDFSHALSLSLSLSLFPNTFPEIHAAAAAEVKKGSSGSEDKVNHV